MTVDETTGANFERLRDRDCARLHRGALATIALCLAVPSVAAAGAVDFPDGRVRLTLPLGYTHRIEDNGSLLVRPPRADLFALHLVHDDVEPHRDTRPHLAIEFVVDAARRKQRPLLRIDGTSHLGFVEPGGLLRSAGETWRSLQGSVAASGHLVRFTLTIPERHARTPEVQAFVGGGLERVLATLMPIPA